MTLSGRSTASNSHYWLLQHWYIEGANGETFSSYKTYLWCNLIRLKYEHDFFVTNTQVDALSLHSRSRAQHCTAKYYAISRFFWKFTYQLKRCQSCSMLSFMSVSGPCQILWLNKSYALIWTTQYKQCCVFVTLMTISSWTYIVPCAYAVRKCS